MTEQVSSVVLRPVAARRISLPGVFREERHIFLCQIREIPNGIPTDANPREPNTNRRVYKEILASLFDEDVSFPGTFHLKHKGITIVAERVEKISENEYRLCFSDDPDLDQGMVDGAHTYQLITDARATEPDRIPEQQFVKIEVITGIEPGLVPDIAGGLNTGLQVKQYSLYNLEGKFEWIKESLKGQPYANRIAWRENQDGDATVLDILSLMSCFNIGRWPPQPQPGQRRQDPVIAYEKKSAVLAEFHRDEGPSESGNEGGQDHYRKLSHILPDILELYDRIRMDAKQLWAQENYNSKFGDWSFVDHRSKGQPYTFPFLPEGENQGYYRLMNAAAYPILAAFRWMVEEDPATGKYRWRGGFEAVKTLWENSAVDLLGMTYQSSLEHKRNPNAMGKSRTHWEALFNLLAMRELMATRDQAAPIGAA